jgi:YggT family protein
VARGQTSVSDLLEAMVRPWLRPIRRYLPLVGGIDLSPYVLSVGLQIAIVILKAIQAALLGLLH